MKDNECGMYAGQECLAPNGYCSGEACLRRLQSSGLQAVHPDDLAELNTGEPEEPGTERSSKADM